MRSHREAKVLSSARIPEFPPANRSSAQTPLFQAPGRPLVCLRCNIDPLASAALESTRASSRPQSGQQAAGRSQSRAHSNHGSNSDPRRPIHLRAQRDRLMRAWPARPAQQQRHRQREARIYSTHPAPAQTRRRRPGSRLGPGAAIQYCGTALHASRLAQRS